MKKVLVLGGTGAMGVYLVPELLSKGYKVDVVSMDEIKSEHPNLRYYQKDAKDIQVLKDMVQENGYDGVVDFMCYFRPEETFAPVMDLFLNHCEHYIFLSSYRVYSNADEITTEESPHQLYHIKDDPEYLAKRVVEYSFVKTIGEEMLKNSQFRNWTIVRPAITYSKRRFQLTTCEADLFITRMREGKVMLLPEGAKDVQATMTWAGDVAKMLAAILFNEKAMGEAYTTSTAEHHTWGEIAEMYKRIGGLKYRFISDAEFLTCHPGIIPLKYDREINRIMDNSKILALTGMRQEELMPLEQGLRMEIENLPEDVQFITATSPREHLAMDRWLENHPEE